jgi:hypothetical protein
MNQPSINQLQAFAEKVAANLSVKVNLKQSFEMTVMMDLIYQCQSNGYAAPDVDILRVAVREIIDQHFNFIGGDHNITVGYLRNRIANLPDNMPVLIERADDSWHESANIQVDFERSYTGSQDPEFGSREFDRIHTNGKRMTASVINAMRPFNAALHLNKDNKQAFVLTVSY